jgi:peptidoglycan biosynthesis protein MviN/MurJ (putative lipid II flippase)
MTLTGAPDGTPEPIGTISPGDGSLTDGSELAAPESAISDSMSVAFWTAVSRLTGVLRGITIAAVLGATYFANTYQFTNSLPNLIFYGLLAGSMFASLLIPALVHHIDAGDRQATARIAGGLLGVAVLGMLALVPIAAVTTPWLLHLGSADVANAAAAHSQAHEGAVLILLFLPQVPLYAIVTTAVAVMNAHRRFALAAAAPALENLGTITVLGVAALLYSRTVTTHDVPFSLLILLGAGTTGAVLLHASAQWWGARRVGVVLVPSAGWRDPDVRATIRRALPAAAQAALVAVQVGTLMLVADRVAGGVVAVQLGINFYSLPVALGATPVAISLVPRLSRMTAPAQVGLFRDTWVRGLVFASFLVVPAATAYVVIARPLAGAIGFGAFAAGGGRALIAAALAGLGLAVVGETLFAVTSYAYYARKDTSRPLRGMVIQTVVCAVGIATVAHLRGAALLTGLGLAYSAGTIAAAGYLVHRMRRALPRGGEPTLRPLLRTAACSAIMAVPVWAAARYLAGSVRTAAGHAAVMIVICLAGAGIYFAAQAAVRAPQMEWLAGALLGRWRRWPAHAAAAALLPVRQPLPSWHPHRPLADAMQLIGPWLRRRQLDAALLVAPLAVGALTVVKLKYAVGAVILIMLIGWVMARPAVGAYLLVLLTPLVVGLNAGLAVPGVRLNEALMAVVGVGVGLRWLVRVRTGEVRWPRIGAVDICLIAVCVTSSVVPLAMMLVRQRPITSDDLLYSIVLWKLFAEYVIVRAAITTREQALRCLVLLMVAAAVVSLVGITQAGGVSSVNAFLSKYTSSGGLVPVEGSDRGGSLVGLPAAAADLDILSLGIAIAMIARGYPHRLWLGGLAVVYVLGVVAAAEFATVIGLVIVVAALMLLTRSARIAAYAAPVAALAGVLLWPIIQTRLAGFQSDTGLPLSWVDRLFNLRTFFWPVLFSDNNWVLGVEPAARVATPLYAGGYVWIESGYTWLLWGGGIPLLASYLAFAGSALRRACAYARRADPAGVAATALAAALCSQVVLMTLDPHLTYRGSGDELFMILALVRVLPARRSLGVRRSQPAAAAATAPLAQGSTRINVPLISSRKGLAVRQS